MQQRHATLYLCVLTTARLLLVGGQTLAQMSIAGSFARLPGITNEVLNGKQVYTDQGEVAGKVSFLIRRGGYILAVRVQLTPDRDVLLNNGDVRYDEKNSLLVTRIPLKSLKKRSHENILIGRDR